LTNLYPTFVLTGNNPSIQSISGGSGSRSISDQTSSVLDARMASTRDEENWRADPAICAGRVKEVNDPSSPG
jgi:hypothetical protein